MGTTSRLSEDQVLRLRDAIDPFLGTPFEAEGAWRKMSDDDLWFRLICQVADIGSAAGGVRLGRDEKARTQLAWERLVKLDDDEALVSLWTVLRKAGVRFVGAEITKDRKGEALVHNLRALERAGGPKKYFRTIARMKIDLDRVNALCRDLKSIKNKSARDLLIGLGMVQDFIAFDSRIQKVLKALGIEAEGFSDAARYRALEEMFLAAVPELGVTCLAHLDRVLFNNTDAILSRLGGTSAPTGSVTIRLSDESRSALDRLAKSQGIGPHELARRLLEACLGAFRQ
jgi:hypothetical protein